MWAAESEAAIRTVVDTAHLSGANPFGLILRTVVVSNPPLQAWVIAIAAAAVVPVRDRARRSARRRTGRGEYYQVRKSGEVSASEVLCTPGATKPAQSRAARAVPSGAATLRARVRVMANSSDDLKCESESR
jgi:hypothetical protein